MPVSFCRFPQYRIVRKVQCRLQPINPRNIIFHSVDITSTSPQMVRVVTYHKHVLPIFSKHVKDSVRTQIIKLRLATICLTQWNVVKKQLNRSNYMNIHGKSHKKLSREERNLDARHSKRDPMLCKIQKLCEIQTNMDTQGRWTRGLQVQTGPS